MTQEEMEGKIRESRKVFERGGIHESVDCHGRYDAFYGKQIEIALIEAREELAKLKEMGG